MDNEKGIDVEADASSSRKPLIMPSLPKTLSIEEKKYLLAIERGDLANVRRMLQKAHRKKSFDINCMDSLGRGALSIAIDQENLEMVELLIVMGVETRDALLQAISVEFVEAVELLLEYEELIHKEGEPYSWQKVDLNTAMFTPDITPLILAAHRNNYEILKILLDRGATVPMPHDIKCGCDDCIRQSEEDSLRYSLSRLNEYKALASPSLIALSSSDPLLTAFQLSWELRNLAFSEPECKAEYMELRRQCQKFAVDLLDQSRSSEELAIILNHDPDNPPYEEGEHMKLARLELAIMYKQKKFVSHPNIQQLLAALWYEGVPGFRRKKTIDKVWIIIKVALLFPFYCMVYMIAPSTQMGKLVRKPFMKFLIHASSYLFFLLLLILVSQRAEDQLLLQFGTESMIKYVQEKNEKQRGNNPTVLEYAVLLYVIGFIVEETQEMINEGINSYLRNLWNFIDFTRNLLYTLVVLLRIVAYIEQYQEIRNNPETAYIKRENWQAFDPQLIAEGLFAAANIFSALKLVHLFSINPHLGPLQISLGRMVIDIIKFFFIYTLVLFAFACGLNQLLWYFSDLERQKCYKSGDIPDFDNNADACLKWRRFANVFESSQSLFWASFGMVDLGSFELTGIKTYTRFWGLLMFGSYSVINVIVLLNLLIAMMSNSYAMIDEHSDTEWKFARTKLWLSYFEESGTLPPPFNIFPKPKNFLKLFGLRKKDKLRRMSTKRRNREEKERDYRYTAVMRSLVWRYVSAMHRKFEENAVTEDDINEVKSDISSFRYEIMDVLSKNGMDTSSAQKKEKAVLGKRMKVWERRLMKDFKVAPVTTEEDEDLLYEAPPVNETSLAKFRRIAKMAAMTSNMNKWRQVVKGACMASQIGHCHSRDSFKKQQNLQKAMEQAKKLAVKSPEQSKAITPIHLPDTTGSNIVRLVLDEEDTTSISPISTFINDKKSPRISVIPPPISPKVTKSTNLQKTEKDLINLESAKTSPIFAKSNIKEESKEYKEIHKDINEIEVHKSAENSETSKETEDQIKGVKAKIDYINKEVEMQKEGPKEKIERPIACVSPKIDRLRSKIEASSSYEEKRAPSPIQAETKIEIKPEIKINENFINKEKETDRISSPEPSTSKELAFKDNQSQLPAINLKEKSKEKDDKNLNKEAKQISSLQPETAEKSSSLSPKPKGSSSRTSPEPEKSPMTQRNIQRVHAKKQQPKYGWL